MSVMKSQLRRDPPPHSRHQRRGKKFSFPRHSFFSFTNGGSISATIYLLPSLQAYINTSFRPPPHLPEKKGASITLSPPEKEATTHDYERDQCDLNVRKWKKMVADIGREINATHIFFGGGRNTGVQKCAAALDSVKISNLSTIADSFVFVPPPGEIRRRHPKPLQRAHSKTLNKGEGGGNFLIAASPSLEKFDDFFKKSFGVLCLAVWWFFLGKCWCILSSIPHTLNYLQVCSMARKAPLPPPFLPPPLLRL